MAANVGGDRLAEVRQRLDELEQLRQRAELTGEQSAEWHRLSGEAEGLLEKSTLHGDAAVDERVVAVRARLSQLDYLRAREELSPDQSAEWYSLTGEAEGLAEVPGPAPSGGPATSGEAAATAWYRRPVLWIALIVIVAVIVVLVVLLTGGGSSTTDAQPGRYRGSGDDGFAIAFTVDDAAEGISELSIEVTCGPITRTENVSFTPALPIEAGRFELPPAPGGPGVTGRFVDAGSGATGGWSSGSCSGNWDGELVPGSAPAAAGPGADGEGSAATDEPADTAVSAEPDPADEPGAIPATDSAISAGSHEFSIPGVGVDTTVMGMQPAGLTGGSEILFVEFDLLAGDRAAFEELEIPVTDGGDLRALPVARISGGATYALASLTMTGEPPNYTPDPDHITWAFVVPRGADGLQLLFPSGEIIDLTPAIGAPASQPEPDPEPDPPAPEPEPPAPEPDEEATEPDIPVTVPAEAVAFCELYGQILESTEDAGDFATVEIKAQWYDDQLAAYDELTRVAPADISADAAAVHQFWGAFIQLFSQHDYDMTELLDDPQASDSFYAMSDDTGPSFDALDAYALSTCGLG